MNWANVLWGVLGGVARGLITYFTRARPGGESFDWQKFGRSLAEGGLVGFLLTFNSELSPAEAFGVAAGATYALDEVWKMKREEVGAWLQDLFDKLLRGSGSGSGSGSGGGPT